MTTNNMTKDYEFVIKAIRNKDNSRYHFPALKNLISFFALKWNSDKSKRYEVYLQSLNNNLNTIYQVNKY
jgi:hypothetical protein